MSKFRLFGHRVLVEKVSVKLTGKIFIPEASRDADIHKVGRVIEVGDGRVKDKPDEPSLVKTGDLVFFQVNEMMAASNSYIREKKMFLNIHQRDLIARIDDPEADVTPDTFTPLGKWVLLSLEAHHDGVLVLPEKLRPEDIHFKVFKKGSQVRPEIEIGQEVMINLGRSNPLVIGRTEFIYIVDDEVLGIVEPEAKAA